MTDSEEKGEVIPRLRMEPNSAAAWNSTGLWGQSSPPASPPHTHQHQGEVDTPGSQSTQPHPCLSTEPCHPLKSVKRMPPFFFFFFNQSGEAENKEPGRRGAGGQGLSSRGIPVGTSKIRVIRLPSSQTGLFSAASCLLKILFTQKLGVPKPLSFKHTHTHTLNLYKTFLTLQHLPRKQKKTVKG